MMRVAWFPKSTDLTGNPYWPRLQEELEALGVEFETSHSSYWMAHRWLWQHRARVGILHFHFVQPHYAGVDGHVSLRRLGKFGVYLAAARLLGYHIVWTMHELVPTWPLRPEWMERLARWMIAQSAHDVIVHCEEARRLLAARLGRKRRGHVLPLPSYAGTHPNNLSQAQARERLGIPTERNVLGFIGGVRPNKGLEDLIAAFQRIEAPDHLLLIAGRPWPPQSYVDQVRLLAEADPRIILLAQEIPDEDMQLYLNAPDVLVFPFRRVLTSSSVILAMSFGRPVIVPRMGCLPELVGDDAGFVYEPGNVNALAAAIEKAASADLGAMGAAAARRTNAYTWHDLALAILKVYGDPRNHRARGENLATATESTSP